MEDFHPRTHGLNTTMRLSSVELHGGGKVHFGDDGHVRRVENRWIFKRLVLAFGNGEQNETKILSQIKSRRADEIAHVFDEKKIQLIKTPTFQSRRNHLGFQMAHGAGGDLLDGYFGASKAARVVIGGQVADESGNAIAVAESAEDALQKRRFARTGTGNETDDVNAGLLESRA